MQVRHGDLLIETIEKLPLKLRKRNSLVILYGEVTGHKHQLSSGFIFDGPDGTIYLDLQKTADLFHEEHNTLKLKKGKYLVKRQREYLSSDMVRLVVD